MKEVIKSRFIIEIFETIGFSLYVVFVYSHIDSLTMGIDAYISQTALLAEIMMLSYVVVKNYVKKYRDAVLFKLALTFVYMSTSALGLYTNDVTLIIIIAGYTKGLAGVTNLLYSKLFTMELMSRYDRFSSRVYESYTDTMNGITAKVSIAVFAITTPLTSLDIDWRYFVCIMLVTDAYVIYSEYKIRKLLK
jgi:hypothetical protein